MEKYMIVRRTRNENVQGDEGKEGVKITGVQGSVMRTERMVEEEEEGSEGIVNSLLLGLLKGMKNEMKKETKKTS